MDLTYREVKRCYKVVNLSLPEVRSDRTTAACICDVERLTRVVWYPPKGTFVRKPDYHWREYSEQLVKQPNGQITWVHE